MKRGRPCKCKRQIKVKLSEMIEYIYHLWDCGVMTPTYPRGKK